MPETPVERPATVLFELEVPEPQRVYAAIRELWAPELPRSAELALGHVLGFGPLVATSFDVEAPFVAAYAQNDEATSTGDWVFAARVRSGAELAAQLTTGSSPSHHVEIVRGQPCLVASSSAASATGTSKPQAASPSIGTSKPRWPLGVTVFGNVAVFGGCELNSSIGPYAAQGVAQRVARAGAVRGRVTRGGLRSWMNELLVERWSALRAQLESAARSDELHRGRPADFADPAGALAKLNRVVETVREFVGEASGLVFDVERDGEFVKWHAFMEGQSPLWSKLKDRTVAVPSLIWSLPSDTAFAVSLQGLWQEPAAGKSAEQPGPALGIWGHRATPQQIAQLERAWNDVAGALTGEQTLGLRSGRIWVGTGQVQDASLLERGLKGLFSGFSRPPLEGPLSALLGKPTLIPARKSPGGTQFRASFATTDRAQTQQLVVEVGSDRYWFASAAVPAGGSPAADGPALSREPWVSNWMRQPQEAIATLYLNPAALGGSARPAPGFVEFGLERGSPALWGSFSAALIELARRAQLLPGAFPSNAGKGP
ncbi:MAG TPA: hypothetical protein VFQ61_08215 [Polyangiaceae bacterium]|nr:hypothetical protein [Polyangiaceae bacterium]